MTPRATTTAPWSPIIVAALCLLGTGCYRWTDKQGTCHTLLIGVGVVSVNNTRPEVATVTRTRSLGVTVDSGGLTAGYSARFMTGAMPGTNDVLIEALEEPFNTIKIEIQSVPKTSPK